MRIDAHHHFWQLDAPFDYSWLDAPELAPIRRDYLPEHLVSRIRQAGIDGTVCVQTQHDLAENEWALSLAEEHEFIVGVVGWVDLASDRCEQQLEPLTERPKFVGVRHVTQDEPDDDFIIRTDILRGLQVLERHRVPFDLLFYVRHLKHAVTVADHVPELPLVIDHLAKPKIAAGELTPWQDELRDAARRDNVFCKLSGMVTEADWNQWQVDDLKPYVETALEAFGPDRCMFGSDWPVCELAGSYTDVHAALAELVGTLTESENDAIFGRTAAHFYQLGVEREADGGGSE